LNQESYRRLISGRTGGLAAASSRFFLRIISWFYSAVVAVRNCLYSRGWLKTHCAGAVVISVGNITTGGTGKTPLVIRLCNLLSQKAIPCAILTRGYRTAQNYTDEPAILAANCPHAKVIVNPDRVAGAAEAVGKFGAKALIMDDGFQHRRLHRDLDIVVIDATQPFGYDKLLPAGLLREPVTALKRAQAVILTRCDQASESELSRVELKLHQINPDMLIARSVHAAVCAKTINNKQIDLTELSNKNVFAFCGIGNPDAFFKTVKGVGANLVGWKVYNDHYHYADRDIIDIWERARHLSCDWILSTEKDRTKVAGLHFCETDIPFADLVVELKFLTGEDKLADLIHEALAGKILKK